MCIVYNLTLHISRVLIGEHLIFCSSTSPTCCHSSSKRAPVNSPVAKGVWYDKLGGILPPIWMSTIMSKVSKKIGCQEKFNCQCAFYRPESRQTRFFCVPTGTR